MKPTPARPLTLALAALAACTSGDAGVPDAGPEAYDRRALLAALGTTVILPTYEEFVGAAQALHTAAAAQAADPSAAHREAAQAAWRSAMAIWEEAEVQQVGPAGAQGATTGGQGLRDELYAWPSVNACRIDQELVAGSYAKADFFATALVNVYGLAALEYLIFEDSDQNACAAQAPINASGTWAALGAAERTKRRAAYASAAAGHLVVVATKLADAWRPGKGDFAALLGRAGESGTPFASARVAVDEVFAAMFYVDLVTKDLKLAAPAGLDGQCANDTCPEKVESRWAHASKEAIVANLRGLRRILTGGTPAQADARGFDDVLVALGSAPLATSLVADLDAAITAAQALPGTLEEALASAPTQVVAVHAAVKKVTDVLKSQFVTVLGLKVPQEGAADND